MPTFEITIDFEVFCTDCGAGLCNVSQGHSASPPHSPFVEVQPCEKCLEQKFDEGYHQGTLNASSD